MSLLLGDMLVRYRADVTDLSVKSGIAKAEIGGFGSTAMSVGSMVAGGLLAAGSAAVAFGLASSKMAGDFEQSTNQFVTSAGEFPKNMDMVRQGILKMSVDTATSTQQLVAGMFNIESAGYHGAAGLTVLKSAAMGAKAENADLSAVTDILTTVLKGYHLPVSQATDITNSLVKTTSEGKMHLDDLTSAFKNVVGIASIAGVPLTDVEGALATMSLQSDKGASAGTHLSQMLTSLLAPSSKATKELKLVGLTTQQISDEMKVSLPGTVKMITDAVGEKFPVGSAKYIAALSAIVGGNKQMKAVLELSGKSFDDFKNNAAAIAPTMKANSTSVENWGLIQSSFNFKLDAAKNSVSALMITAGTQLLPVIGSLLTMITPLIMGFTGWLTSGDRLKNTITTVVNVVSGLVTGVSGLITNIVKVVGFFQQNETAALALLPVLGALGGYFVFLGVSAVASFIAAAPAMITGFVAGAAAAWTMAAGVIAATWPFILIGAAIGLLVVGIILLVQHWGAVVSFMRGVWGGFSSWFMSALKSIGGFFVGIWSGIVSGFQAAIGFIVNVAKIGFQIWFAIVTFPIRAIAALFIWLYEHNTYFQKLVDAIIGFFKAGFTWLTDQWTRFTGWISGIWKGIGDKASSIFGGVSDTVKSKSAQAGSWLSDNWGKASSATMGFLATIGKGVLDAWNFIATVFEVIWSKYIGPPLTAAWTKFVDWFANLGKLALQSGQNFISMLVSGITSGAGAIWGAVSGIAKNIWSALGFHSPTEAGPGKDADTWMPNLIKMMVSGLNAGVPSIKTASQNVAAPLQQQLAYPIKPSAIAVTGAAAASQGSGYEHVTIVELNGHQLAHIVNTSTDRTVRLKLGAAQGRSS